MLKRLSLLIAIILLFAFIPQKQLLFNDVDGIYTFYLGSDSSNCQMVTVSSQKAIQLKSQLKNVVGESLMTNDIADIEKFLKSFDAELVFEEQVGSITCKYYYSNKIAVYKTINGKNINLQTAEDENAYTIGSPMIFGSY